MSDNIYISGKPSNNRITISSRETNNNLNTQNNNAKYYSDKALESAENAKHSAEEAKQSAQVAQDSASSILNDEGFIAVSQNLEPINTVANTIDDVSYVASNAEKIEQIVEDLNNLGDTTNINIVATNIDTVNTNAENIISINKVANSIDSVNDVADSINGVNEIANNLTEVLNSKTYANQAKSSATTATNQATIATNKANEAINTVANTLNKTQISNCLLEVPQRINLELKDGVLTLKAGSELICPNGFEANGTTRKFDYVKVTSDAQLNVSDLNSPTSEDFFIFVTTSNFAARNATGKTCYSGDTEPDIGSQKYSSWYDTKNNLMKHTNDSGATWLNNYKSYPICIITRTNGIATSIKQVFNGFGYIGSTVWVDKGVKGLIPKGRNADGTLKNQEVTAPRVLMRTISSGTIKLQGMVLYANDITWRSYYVQEEVPSVVARWYNPKTNYMYVNNSGDVSVVQTDNSYYIGDVGCTNGKIDYIRINEPFRAVDYNDYKADLSTKVNKAGDTMTGDLRITKNSKLLLILQNTSDDRDVAPSTSAGTNYVALTDKNNATIAQFSNERITDGRNTAKIQVFGKGGENAPAIRVHAYADGRQGCQFPMCTTKPTTTSSARNDLVAVVVQNYINGTSWYRVYSDGWCEQGSIQQLSDNWTITFLKPFKNGDYSLIGECWGMDAYANLGILTQTETQATGNIMGSAGAKFTWEAKGYIN